MEPKNEGLEDVSPFPRGYFQVPCLFSGVYLLFPLPPQKNRVISMQPLALFQNKTIQPTMSRQRAQGTIPGWRPPS